jgi:hypothetical protein
MTELDEQERLFLQQATQVNAWDRLLVDNGEKVRLKYSEIVSCLNNDFHLSISVGVRPIRSKAKSQICNAMVCGSILRKDDMLP